MSTDLLSKGLIAGLLSLALAGNVFCGYDRENGSESEAEKEKGKRQKYLPLINGLLFPVLLLILFVLSLILYGRASTFKMLLNMCFAVFLHISFYYLVLLMALPIIRKRVCARTCAALWLLPNYLYLTQTPYMQLPEPQMILRVPGKLPVILMVIWTTGFTAVFLWNIAGHLLFRRKILKHSVPVTDLAVLGLFRKELEEVKLKRSGIQLAVTEDVSAPLTIGLFRRSMRILLPQKQYSAEELQLIFRHELVHISREDSWAKFFMVFCTAMCWFNPLMWLAMKKSAEDTERSCDETVLLGADESKRRQYAELILKAAGDERGFSTCLSASAAAVRYRLKAIVNPGKRRTGAVVAGVTFFLLCMTCGYVSLAYGEDTGAVTVFRSHSLEAFTADEITVSGGEYVNGKDYIDAEALTQYIAELPTQEMTGDYSYSDDEKTLSIFYESSYGAVSVELYTDYIKVLHHNDEYMLWHAYYLPEPVDWEYVDSIVPPLPQAEVFLSDDTGRIPHHIYATVTKLVRKQDGNSVIFKDRGLQSNEGIGVYGKERDMDAAVTFSMPLISDVEILAETLADTSVHTVPLESASDGITFQVPARPAHYTITASFQGTNGIYEAAFVFHVHVSGADNGV